MEVGEGEKIKLPSYDCKTDRFCFVIMDLIVVMHHH